MSTYSHRDQDGFLDGVHKKSVSDGIRQCNKERKLQEDSETFIASQNITAPLDRKNGQGLIQEMSSSMSLLKEKIPEVSNHVTKISETVQSWKSDILIPSLYGTSMIEISQHLAQLCNEALIAEECTLEANQEEIFCW